LTYVPQILKIIIFKTKKIKIEFKIEVLVNNVSVLMIY